jgi:hypothetical protein
MDTKENSAAAEREGFPIDRRGHPKDPTKQGIPKLGGEGL